MKPRWSYDDGPWFSGYPPRIGKRGRRVHFDGPTLREDEQSGAHMKPKTYLSPDGDVNRAINEAEPGHVFVYHIGFLPKDRENNPQLAALAGLLWHKQLERRVQLTQRRLGEESYEYLAVRRAYGAALVV